ncbi:hypothetical protein MJV30_004453 [Salmonella enterica]|nr:hypothetical protein [Salmonella enterica]
MEHIYNWLKENAQNMPFTKYEGWEADKEILLQIINLLPTFTEEQNEALVSWWESTECDEPLPELPAILERDVLNSWATSWGARNNER